MQVVVLAGGLATRMRPKTEQVPKALLEVAGRPFIDWQMELLARHGTTEVVMCIAYLADMIRDHVGDGARYGLSVIYVEDRELLGTAGAVRGALPHLADVFLVTYGDSYLPFDYSEPVRILRDHADADAVMSVYRNEGKWEVSNVELDGDWVRRYDKTARAPEFHYVDYGALGFRRSVFEAMPPGKLGLDVVQKDLAAQHRLRACVARERFYEIGSPGGLAELDTYLRTQS